MFKDKAINYDPTGEYKPAKGRKMNFIPNGIEQVEIKRQEVIKELPSTKIEVKSKPKERKKIIDKIKEI